MGDTLNDSLMPDPDEAPPEDGPNEIVGHFAKTGEGVIFAKLPEVFSGPRDNYRWQNSERRQSIHYRAKRRPRLVEGCDRRQAVSVPD